MDKFNFSVIILAICFIFSASAMAESMTRNQYISQKKTIDVEYKSAQAGCDSLAGNATDICIAKAKSKKNVAYAELKYQYKPSVKSRFGFSIAKADAEYLLEADKCNDRADRTKDLCVKEARAVQIQQITDAKVEAKTMKVKPDTNAEMTDQEQIDDDADKAVTDVKPAGSETIPFEEDIFEDQIRVLARL